MIGPLLLPKLTSLREFPATEQKEPREPELKRKSWDLAETKEATVCKTKKPSRRVLHRENSRNLQKVPTKSSTSGHAYEKILRGQRRITACNVRVYKVQARVHVLTSQPG